MGNTASALLWATLSVTLAGKAAAQQNGTPAAFRAIHAELLALTAGDSAPAIAIAVAHHGRIVYEAGFGFGDPLRMERVTPHTPFAVASISKAITATALMRLADRGAIDIDRPLYHYLPGETRALEGDSSRLTPATLAAMSAGIPHLSRHHWTEDAASARSAQQLVLDFGHSVFPPGETFHYSNMSFGVLERLFEAVLEKSFADVVDDEVFRPLGMHNSFFATRDQRRAYAVRRTSSGSLVNGYVFTEPVAGAGLISSAHDLALFGSLQAGRPIGAHSVLSSHALSRMHQPQRAEWSYGLGVFTNSYNVIADGSVLGGAGIVSVIPSEELAVVVVTNAATATSPTYSFSDRLIDAALEVEGKTQRRMSLPAFYATKPYAADSAFSGTWDGALTYPARQIPVSMIVAGDSIMISMDGRPTTLTAQPTIDAGMLRFQFHGVLPDESGTLSVTLHRHGTVISGYVREPTSARYGLGYPRYIRLSRR